MEQVQIQAPQTRTLLDSSNQFYQDLLGYKPEQTSLQQIPEFQWNQFIEQMGLNPNSFGIYLPRNQTAIIQGANPLSLFHEYFGHGLYCEQSLAGRKLVDLEKRLLEEEKQEFSSGTFTLGDIQRFRQQNQTFQELEKFRQENLGRYELFAIWTEYLLSGEHNLRGDFERKYDSLSKEEREAVDSVIGFSEQYGSLATMYAQGMARRTTVKRIRRLLQDIYKDKIKNVNFALLYGSRKEFSDIDVFIVSDDFSETDSWLDVRVYSPQDFERRIGLFDIAATNPIITGDFLFGDKNYFWQLKNQLLFQPITEEAINYNLEQSKNQIKLAERYPENSRERKRGLSYSKTYLATSLVLKEGKRIFDRNELILYLQMQAPVEGDKPPRLKGGKFK
jgi:hypothetical protein